MPRLTRQSTVDPADPELRIDLDEVTTPNAPSLWIVTIRRGRVVEAETKFGSRSEAVPVFVSMSRECRLDHDQRELARKFAEDAADPSVVSHREEEAKSPDGKNPNGCFICAGDHATADCEKAVR